MARRSGNAPFCGSTAVVNNAFDASVSKSTSTSKSASTSESKPALFIVSGVRLYREGVVRSLSRQPNVAVIGAADTSPATISEMIDRKPDVVILDVGDPGSFEFAKAVNVNLPGVKIIAFAVGDIEHEVLACAAAGFAGYVARDGSEVDLIAAVESALRGELQVTPRIASLLFRQVAALSAQQLASSEPSALTQREHHILALVAQGSQTRKSRARFGSAAPLPRIMYTASWRSSRSGGAVKRPPVSACRSIRTA